MPHYVGLLLVIKDLTMKDRVHFGREDLRSMEDLTKVKLGFIDCRH